MKTLCLCLLLIAQVARAQSAPEPRALLEREALAFDTFNSYSYVEETTTAVPSIASGAAVQSGGGGGIAGVSMSMPDTRMTMAVTGMNPGKRRLVMRLGDEETVLVADGKDTWLYLAPAKIYARIPDDADAQSAFGAGGLSMPLTTLTDARLLRSESMRVDGQAHDCWVVEARATSLPALSAIEIRNLTVTAWIDKTLGVAWRRTVTGQLALGPQTQELNVVTARRALVINGPVDEASFVFTPPAGTRRDDEFLTQVLALMQPPAATAPSAPPRAGLQTGGPQAYVPSLTPVTQVEPVWPATAKASGEQGIVEVLVTIDPQGAVTAAEALTGPKALRGAAEEAVRRERFQPVTRGGSPVAAYTTRTVPFLDYKAGIAAVPEVNLGEELAAQRRLEELSQKWPRSKQDELQDMENDLGGVAPEARRFFLPRLARAAWDAGAVDKAEAYAIQAIGSSNPDGDAIHDGHVVLGLLAMKSRNVGLARDHLLEAGQTTGSPVLNSFGPDLALAQQLLDAGERTAVLEYLTSCERFWQSGRKQLREWRAAIEGGGKPTLNRFAALSQVR